jgi:hypothetical protein
MYERSNERLASETGYTGAEGAVGSPICEKLTERAGCCLMRGECTLGFETFC